MTQSTPGTWTGAAHVQAFWYEYHWAAEGCGGGKAREIINWTDSQLALFGDQDISYTEVMQWLSQQS